MFTKLHNRIKQLLMNVIMYMYVHVHILYIHVHTCIIYIYSTFTIGFHVGSQIQIRNTTSGKATIPPHRHVPH